MFKFLLPHLRTTLILFGISSGVSQAQITTDGSINTQVNSADQRNFRINGGQQVGQNLFHSFEDFSVPTNGSALFNNQANITNIIGRVTGATVSNIDGIIESQGSANLFLFNPNGIIFGPSAQLDIGGSFLASTADTIQFNDGQEFSALNTQRAPLLAINMPLGLQLGNTPAPVRVLSSRLVVNRGQSLLLAGGGIGIRSAIRQDAERDIARLIARGGRVELSALAAAGEVELTRNGGFKTSSAPRKADIRLSGAVIDVAGGGGGHIDFDARNIDIADQSTLEAGIALFQGRLGAQAGDINLQATEDISIQRKSRVANGLGGLPLEQIMEVDPDAPIVRPQAFGNGGDINVKANTLTIRDGSEISADNSGRGDTGNINVQVKDSVLLEREILIPEEEREFSGSLGRDRNGITSNVNAAAIGNTGDVVIETGELTLRETSRIQSSSFGEGDAGRVIIRATDSISLEGDGNNILSAVDLTNISEDIEGLSGSTGGIDIETGSLIVKRAGRIESSIRTGGTAPVSGTGSSGLVKIMADSILLEGESDGERNDGRPRRTGSGIFSVVQPGTIGILNPGIEIETGSLTLRDGGRIRADTFGQGVGGNVNIRAKDFVRLEGNGTNSGVGSSISSASGNERPPGQVLGNAGNITIETGLLSVRDGGQIRTNTFRQGNAGQVTIRARESIVFEGQDIRADFPDVDDGVEIINPNLPGGVFSSTEATSTGNAGGVDIKAPALLIQNGAEVTVNHGESGQGGDINLDADLLTLDQGSVTAETASGLGGNISLEIGSLLQLRNNSQISATAGNNQTEGDGGNITISSPIVFAIPNENSDIKANAFEGRGGEITINTQGLFGLAEGESSIPSNDITARSEVGIDGLVQVETSDVDRTDNLVKLPETLPNTILTQRCQQGGESTFVDSRGGGYPPSPAEIGSLPSSSWEDLRPVLSPRPEREQSITSNNAASEQSLVEAQGWSQNPNGQIALVADTSKVTASGFTQSPRTCRS